MTAHLRHGLCVLALGCVSQGPFAALHAQSPPPSFPAPPVAQTVNAHPSAAQAVKSPVEEFRELLAMNEGEREHLLASRPPENRHRILAKVQEYEAMKPEDRELRLRMTELRWHLLRLMALPPAERPQQIALLPEADRKPVSNRLQQWDRLTPSEQSEILQYEATMEQCAGQRPETVIQTNTMPLRPDIAINLNNLLHMPPEKRQQIYSSFQRFFELNEEEKQATLEALTGNERGQVMNALRTLEKMPQAQRDQYFLAFKRFAAMSDAERENFEKNAERWQALTPAEREAWRNLVNHVPPMPPLPEAADFPPMPPLPQPPLPPLPPGISLQVSLPVGTNSSSP